MYLECIFKEQRKNATFFIFLAFFACILYKKAL